MHSLLPSAKKVPFRPCFQELPSHLRLVHLPRLSWLLSPALLDPAPVLLPRDSRQGHSQPPLRPSRVHSGVVQAEDTHGAKS